MQCGDFQYGRPVPTCWGRSLGMSVVCLFIRVIDSQTLCQRVMCAPPFSYARYRRHHERYGRPSRRHRRSHDRYRRSSGRNRALSARHRRASGQELHHEGRCGVRIHLSWGRGDNPLKYFSPNCVINCCYIVSSKIWLDSDGRSNTPRFLYLQTKFSEYGSHSIGRALEW